MKAGIRTETKLSYNCNNFYENGGMMKAGIRTETYNSFTLIYFDEGGGMMKAGIRTETLPPHLRWLGSLLPMKEGNCQTQFIRDCGCQA